jgi:hypothetical protein
MGRDMNAHEMIRIILGTWERVDSRLIIKSTLRNLPLECCATMHWSMSKQTTSAVLEMASAKPSTSSWVAGSGIGATCATFSAPEDCRAPIPCGRLCGALEPGYSDAGICRPLDKGQALVEARQTTLSLSWELPGQHETECEGSCHKTKPNKRAIRTTGRRVVESMQS